MPRKTLKEIAIKAADYDSRDRYRNLEEMLEDFHPPKPRRDYSKIKRGFATIGYGVSDSYGKLCDRLSDSYKHGLISDFRDNLGVIMKWVGIAGVSFSLVFGAIKGYPVLMNSRAEARFNRYQSEFVLVKQDVASGDYESADARAEAIMQRMIKDGHKGVPELLAEVRAYDDTNIDPQIIRLEAERVSERKKQEQARQEQEVGDYFQRFLGVKELVFQEKYREAEEQRKKLEGELGKEDYAKARSLLEDVVAYEGSIKSSAYTPTIIPERSLYRFYENPYHIKDASGMNNEDAPVDNPANMLLNVDTQKASKDRKHIIVMSVTGLAVVDSDGTDLRVLDLDAQTGDERSSINLKEFGWYDNNTIWFTQIGRAGYWAVDIDSLNGPQNMRRYYPK